jgi:hypothetical protein
MKQIKIINQYENRTYFGHCDAGMRIAQYHQGRNEL